jgi:hypothetical protein
MTTTTKRESLLDANTLEIISGVFCFAVQTLFGRGTKVSSLPGVLCNLVHSSPEALAKLDALILSPITSWVYG